MGVDRRQILAGALASTLAAAAGRAAVAADLDTIASAASELGLGEPAVVLGRAYLAAHPGERDAGFLVRETIGPAGLAGADFRECLACLRERHVRDCDAGDIVNVQGILLSRSEARFCALGAVLGSGTPAAGTDVSRSTRRRLRAIFGIARR